MIRVGPAGWSYDDWNGIVYPSSPPRGFDRLGWISSHFDTVEVNASFYHIPAPRLSRSWASRVGNRRFRFTVKLHRSFTHGSPEPARTEVVAFRRFLEPLVDDDRFGASAGNDLLIGLDGQDRYQWGAGSGNDVIDEQSRYIDVTVGLGGLSLTLEADTVELVDLVRAGVARGAELHGLDGDRDVRLERADREQLGVAVRLRRA
ncbi:MAG: DUF72 domain-containing protein, partial [Acidobacteria bacterium]|nr:DUF72 domain-containing protein [Acidobacteriota bacterium]